MKSIVRLAVVAGLAATFLGVFGAAVGPQEARAETRGVSLRSFAFSPATVNAKVGEAVRWINDEDAVPHTVTTEAAGGFNSGRLAPGDSFSRQFDTAGAYQYFCQIHPRMRGVVLVGDATGAPGTPFAALPSAPISTRMTGANENPAVTTPANGTFIATPGTDSLKWQMQAYGNGLLVAHIHSGAAGTNGPVVAFLYGPDAGKNLVDVGGTLTVANLVGPMAGNWKAFSDALAAGTLYANAHTAANPGGEARGQIPASAAATAPRPPATGTGLAVTSSSTSYLPVAVLATLILLGAGGSATYARSRRSIR